MLADSIWLDPKFYAFLGGLTGGIVTFGTAVATSANRRRADRREEMERIRMKYLNPLRVAATDLRDRLADLTARVKDGGEFNEWVRDFRRIDSGDRTGLPGEDIGRWINTRGYYAAQTLYLCAVYFSHAFKIRSELPLIELSSGDQHSLFKQLEQVRGPHGLGGEHGIWGEAQDSLGSYVRRPDGSILNYKEFCIQLLQPLERVWYQPLLLFFDNAHMKLEGELPRSVRALTCLIEFLEMASHPRAKRKTPMERRFAAP